MRHGLELLDRPAERLPAGGMHDGGIEGGLRHPNDGGADAWPKEIEGPHRELEAAVDLAEDLLLHHENAIQLETADRMRRHQVHRSSAQPFRIAINDESGDPLRSRSERGPREDGVDV